MPFDHPAVVVLPNQNFPTSDGSFVGPVLANDGPAVGRLFYYNALSTYWDGTGKFLVLLGDYDGSGGGILRYAFVDFVNGSATVNFTSFLAY